MSYSKSRNLSRILICIVGLYTLGHSPIFANPVPPSGYMLPYSVATGSLANVDDHPLVVFEEVIDMGLGVPWLRIFFAEAQLPKGSLLRITSLLDGEIQELDAAQLEAWSGGSAFFNGSAVRIELVATPGSRGNRFQIDEVLVGLRSNESIEDILSVLDPAALDSLPEQKAICGMDDNRTPSSNKAIARLLTATNGGGCTGTIIDCPNSGNDKCMISAGHCFVSGPGNHQVSTVAQFDVPSSNANCSIVHPPVNKQFPIVGFTAAFTGVGNDWAVFHTGKNSAKKTAFQEQGVSLKLAKTVPGSGTVRITGFGVDGNNGATGGSNAACSCSNSGTTGSRNQTQQTSTGPISSLQGSTLKHQADTCGANSGSSIVLESSGEVIGIHTSNGCASAVGSNHGTAITHAALQTAIMNSCEPHMVVLLDRTGSMTTTRATGNTRCSDALTLAKSDVASFFSTNSNSTGASAAIWTFSSSSTNLTGGFVNQATAMAALNGLTPEGCTGSTALADAICDASDALIANFPNSSPLNMFLAISSDGGENSSSGACSGTSTTSTTPPFDAGSWQNKVLAKVQGQNTVLTRSWGAVSRNSEVDPETGKQRSRKALADDDFFRILAEETSGEFQNIGDSAPLPPPFFGGPRLPITDIPVLSPLGVVSFSALLLALGVLFIARKRP